MSYDLVIENHAATSTKAITELPVIQKETYAGEIERFNKWNNSQPIRVERIVEYIQNDDIARKPATLNVRKFALKKAIKQVFGQSMQLVELAMLDNVFKEIKTGIPDKKIYSENILSKEQIEIIKSHSSKKISLIIETLSCTGLRISELIAIKVKDVTVNDNVFINITGKGKKERRVFITKTLYNEIVNEFKSQVFLFSNRKNKKFNRFNLYRSIRLAGQKANLNIHPHLFRHSFATRTLIEQGKSLTAVSAYLGHSSTSLTADLYVHDELKPEDILEPDEASTCLFNLI